MEILNAVAHRLDKQRNVKGATVVGAHTEIVKNEALDQLLSNVLESYNSRCSRHTGSFEKDEENFRFSVALRKFVNAKSNFLDFTTTAMSRLRQIINDITFASGGYVLFVRYRHAERDMLLVAQLNQEDGAIFSPDLHEVIQSQYLNLDHLRVAARIDLGSWAAQEDRYLTFVLKKDHGHPSDYFKEFIGCHIDQDSKIESNKLVRVVKDFANHIAEKNVIAIDSVPDIQRRAYDYADSLVKQDEPAGIQFDLLANAVWPDDPSLFLHYLNNHAEQPSAGFIPDKTVFKKLSGISFKSASLSLKMTYEFKQEHVTTAGDTVTILKAPKKLLEELTEG